MIPGSPALSYLAESSVRAACLAVPAAAALWLGRKRPACWRHAVLAVLLVAMLLLPALHLALPKVPLRVPRATAAVPAVAFATEPAGGQPPSGAARAIPQPRESQPWPSWTQIALAAYCAGAVVFLARLLAGYWFVRRLVKASVEIEDLGRAAPGARVKVRESTWTCVPMTAGCLKPVVVLPVGWREWDDAKLGAALAHEESHIRRQDWLVAQLAGLNKAMFWFHPLAWWMERRLAELAEQAADDASLLIVNDRAGYARALLDMASAVHACRGRLVWEAIAMANPSQVRKRIERVLDETTKFSKGLNRTRWVALALAAVPLLCSAAAVRFEAAQAERQVFTPSEGYLKMLVEGNKLTPTDAQMLEGHLLKNPGDVALRGALISHYFLNGVRDQRLKHIFWVIENHPEAELAGFGSAGIDPKGGLLNDESDYARARELWHRQAAAHGNDARVLGNAAQSFAQPGGDVEAAIDLYKRARQIEPGEGWTGRLATLYGAIFASSVIPDHALVWSSSDAALVERLKADLESSTDGWLIARVASELKSGRCYPDRPECAALVEFADRLDRRAEQLGVMRFPPRSNPPPAQAEPSGVALQVSSQEQAARLVQRVDPVYPPLARQARIQGVVRVSLVIGQDGHVRRTQLVAGHPLLAGAAMEAVRQWVYQPVLQSGEPVEVTTRVDVPFVLESPPALGLAGQAVQQQPGVMRIRVGGNVQASKLASRVDPEYPPLARQARIQGVVRFSATIDRDGGIANLQLVSGHPLLVAAAQEAVSRWRYQPTLLNGQPVEVVTQIDVPFTLP